MGRFTKDPTPKAGVIRWDPRLERFELWRESRCVAHSSVLARLQAAYPRALVGKTAYERSRT